MQAALGPVRLPSARCTHDSLSQRAPRRCRPLGRDRPLGLGFPQFLVRRRPFWVEAITEWRRLLIVF